MGIIWSRRKGFNFTQKNVTGSAGVSIISYFYGGIYTKMRQMRRCAGMKLECTEIGCALHWEGVHNRQEKKRKTIYVLSNTIHRLPVSAPVLSERMHICGAEQPRLIGFGWNDYFSFNLMQIKGLIIIAGLNWLHYRTFSSICYMLVHLPYGWLISPNWVAMSHGPWPIRYPCCNIAWSCLYLYIMIIIICTFWPASPILFLLY